MWHDSFICVTWLTRERLSGPFEEKRFSSYVGPMYKRTQSRETPPGGGGGGGLLCGFHIKNPEEENPSWRTTLKIDQRWGWFFKGGPLHPSFWFGNHPTKKPPPGRGFSFDQTRGRLYIRAKARLQIGPDILRRPSNRCCMCRDHWCAPIYITNWGYMRSQHM